MKTKISVVVCAKNEEDGIEQCLKRLSAQKIKPEIILVDGHSRDNTVKIAKKYADIIIKDDKTGIANARNIGAKITSGDIIAYTDADSRPQLDWTKKIIDNINDYIAISGPLIAYNGSKKTKRNLRIFTYHLFRFLNKLNYTCFCGPNMAFKRKYLLKHKFKTNVLEDFEIGSRLKKYGKIGFIKNMIMPISSRRYEKGSLKMILFYYIPNALRIKLGRKVKVGDYFKDRE